MKAKMDNEKALIIAHKLRDAFGPCTRLFECCDVAGIADDVIEFGSAWDALKVFLAVEDATMDQMGVGRTEFKEAMKGIRSRLRAAGFIVPRQY